MIIGFNFIKNEFRQQVCGMGIFPYRHLTVLKISRKSGEESRSTVESRLYVQVGTQKFGRRTERDVQVKMIFRITPCKVFWTRLYPLDVQTSGTYNWETYNWDFTVLPL